MTFSKSLPSQLVQPVILVFTLVLLMACAKLLIFFLTRSTAIFADLIESLVHLLLTLLTSYSLFVSKKPADQEHHYGHDRIAFFSSGFEGATLLVAGLSIAYQCLQPQREVHQVDWAILLYLLLSLANGGLGFYLLQASKRYSSLILRSNSKHLFADCISCLGVLAALLIVKSTGFLGADRLIALLVAAYLLWTSGKLLSGAFHGLMDRADPHIHEQILALLNKECEERSITFHRLRHRLSGDHVHIDVHLLFPDDYSLSKAHREATEIEKQLEISMTASIDVTTHLEPADEHDTLHQKILGHVD